MEFGRRYRADTSRNAELRPHLRLDVLVNPTLTVESEEEYSSAYEDDPAWRRDEEGSGPLFAEAVPLFSMPRPHSTDFVHDKKVKNERLSGGKWTLLPRVAGPDRTNHMSLVP
jgi:hypothetical protein